MNASVPATQTDADPSSADAPPQRGNAHSREGANAVSSGTATDDVPVHGPREEVIAAESRNLATLSAYHICLRIAWIFKTESVMIPAFLDSIAGAPWIRGCLPWLNRFGQSVPPLLYAPYLKSAPLKKSHLLWMTWGMAVPFLTLSALLFTVDPGAWWLKWVFLFLYGTFFSVVGMNMLVFGTVQGKLIRAERRGRLLWLSGLFGSVFAIGAALLLLENWLSRPDGGFAYIFGFTGLVFVAAGLWCFFVVEHPDDSRPRTAGRPKYLTDVVTLLRADRNFRWTVLVGVCFVSSLFLFPHYQALGRQQSGYRSTDLMAWVIAQNFGAGLFSILAGPIADRLGNRFTLRVMLFAATLPPLYSIALTNFAPEVASDWYWLTFLALGTVPIAFRTLTNYTLELCEPADHPRYLSTLKLCIAVPFVLSPLVGWLVTPLGFAPIFLGITAIGIAGGLLTFALHEPRLNGEAA